MNSKRAYFIILGVSLLLFIGILGGTYGVNSLLQAQAGKVVALRGKLAGLQAEQTELTAAKKAVTTYKSLDNIAKVIVPQNKDQAQAVRQIVALAQANNISLESITFPSSNLGTLPGVNSTSAASAAPVTQSASSQSLSQLTPVTNIPGVYDLVITVTTSTDTQATYPEMISFLSGLEQNRLTALVSGISIVPKAGNSSLLSFNLTLDIYIKP